jgi:hypothetical protein
MNQRAQFDGIEYAIDTPKAFHNKTQGRQCDPYAEGVQQQSPGSPRSGAPWGNVH